MNTQTLLKLSLLGLLSLSFVATEVYAQDEDDEDTEEVAPKKKKGKKAKKAEAAPSRMLVAINKFENKSDAPDSVFETIRARVQQCVVGARKFEVVEREQLKAAMSEQNLVASGLTDGEDPDAPEAGKLKAASYIIYGNVLYCGTDKSDGSSEGVASAVVKSKVELQIKITNGETGKILTQKSAIGYGVDKAMATEGFASSTGQGMRDAIDEACHLAADALRNVAYPAKIIRVGKKNVTINMTDEEVKEDDVFDVIQVDGPLTDPDTGAFLGYDGDEIGRVKITRTGPMTSKAEPYEDSLDLSELDTDECTYTLQRVSKATLKKEAKKKSQKKKAAFESRF
ncbi:MAG: CsgG/HfaB family protein [Kiritimatiellae bacterium]|nr:CsgG/HfaB family protein [Kiritimatiellia bacterium]